MTIIGISADPECNEKVFHYCTAAIFLVPVIMVAFPTLKSVKVAGMVIDIQDLTKVVNNNPADNAADNHLKKSIAQLKTRDNFDQIGNALVAVANA